MSITNDNQAALNNGAVGSPRTVVRGSKNHSSPAAHIGPLTPAQSQLQSAVVAGECQQNADFCAEFAPSGVGAPQPEPSTPGSALCERFLDQAHALEASMKNGLAIDRLDALSHGRTNGDEIVLQPASIGEQRRTSPMMQGALCGPDMATSPNMAPNAQPSPAPPNYRQQRVTAIGNGPVRSSPNWPGPERMPIWVFTSQLANDAVNVVYSGGCRSLVDFHMQRVGHRFIPPGVKAPDCGPRFLGPKPVCTAPGCTDCLTKPGPAHGPGRPNASYTQPPGNDKSDRVAEWIAAQQDASSQDEILKQRSAKMAKLEEIQRALKLGKEGSTPQAPPCDGNVKTELMAQTGFVLPSQPSGQRIPAAPDALQPQTAPGPEWTEHKTELSDSKPELKPDDTLQSQIQVPFNRPQSAPSAGPSPSPAAQSIQSPGSLNEASLIHTSSAPASKRRQSTTGNATDKSEMQPKKRRKNTNTTPRGNVEPPVDSMPPPPSNLDMSVKSPGCYVQRPNAPMMPLGPASDARRGNGGNVGPPTPGESVSTLTSSSLSKLAEMTYSMYTAPQNQNQNQAIGNNGVNGMPPPSSAVCPPPQPVPPYDASTRMMMRPPPPLDAYSMMNRPPLPGTNGNAQGMNMQQMSMQGGAAFMQMPPEMPNLTSTGMLNVPQQPNVRGPPGNQPAPMQPPAQTQTQTQTQNRFGPPTGVAFDSGNANNANVQIQPKTPNTIQYRPLHPERPQRADAEVRVPDFRGPQAGPPMQDLPKMGHSPGKLLPMLSGDGRFPINNGAPPPGGFARPTLMNNGPYGPMTAGAGMQQAPPAMANMHELGELGVASPPGYDFAYRQGGQQLGPGGAPPQPNVASPMFNQYASNTNTNTNTAPVRAQQDASMNMSGPQQGMKVGPNVFVHAGQGPAQTQGEAQNLQMQMQMQMQMNAPTQAPQAPPQAGPCTDLNEEDVYYDLLEPIGGALGSFTGTGNAAPAGGFFNPAGTSMLEDVNLLLEQQYANGAPSSANMMQQPPSVGPQSVNMPMNGNMGMQGALRTHAHEMFNANRFAPAYAANMGMNAGGLQPGAIPPNAMQPGNMQPGAMPLGAMPPGAMQGGLARFRRPAPPGMPLDMQMQPGGAMMMGMPMMAEQPPSVFDQPSQHFYR